MVKVRVPATTANLGSGFDCLGMALSLYLDVEMERIDSGFVFQAEGEGVDLLSSDRDNLIYKAASLVMKKVGLDPEIQTIKIAIKNEIPIERGLGSSASAIIGGILAARELYDLNLSREEILQMAFSLEGHLDNIVPALIGGFTISYKDHNNQIRWVKLDVPHELRAVVGIPPFTLSTEEMRKVLPKQVSLQDAVDNLSKSALLVNALQQSKWELIPEAMQDRLHQPFRMPFIKGAKNIFSEVQKTGIAGVALSGSGPTIISLVKEGAEKEIIKIMRQTFRNAGITSQVKVLDPDLDGARIEEGKTSQPIIVQKYGGTSVSDIKMVKEVAKKVVHQARKGNKMIVVVSAMGKTTDELIRKSSEILENPSEREMDMLLSTGEQVSIALVTMAIHALGAEAISFTGGQAGIMTNNSHTKARINSINHQRIKKALDQGKIVIVAGFQGIDNEGNITTLGRGGSDTTAIALAARMKAERCEIYTDVDGVYTADPNFVPKARKIKEISHDEMAEMAILGAKILYYRAIDIARNHRVNILVKQSFHNGNGTVVKTREEIPMLEKVHVRAVTHEINVGKIILKDVPDIPGIAARLFKALANKEIVVDMIIQSAEHDKVNDIAFTVALGDLDRAIKITKEVAKEIGSPKVFFDKEVAKISIVGAGITSDPLIAARMFEALANNHINIDMISTSGMRISCIIHQDHIVDAVRAVHNEFQLDEEGDVNEIL
jgi:aspartate kinase